MCTAALAMALKVCSGDGLTPQAMMNMSTIIEPLLPFAIGNTNDARTNEIVAAFTMGAYRARLETSHL